MEDLDQKPNTIFDRNVVCGLDGLMSLTRENLQKSKNLSEHLETKVSANEGEAAGLRERIHLL